MLRVAILLLLVSCASSSETTTTTFVGPDLFDVPITGLAAADVSMFHAGDALFDVPLRDADGLGPLYVRASCGACHDGGLRGPGSVTKMSIVGSDGITPVPDQSKLPYGASARPLMTAGATTPIAPPANDPSVRLSVRVGPPVLGRGYMEAVPDGELDRVAAAQALRSDGIHGRVNHVVYNSVANPDTTYHSYQKGDHVIGRFGLKARVATLDDFTADALQGDMGVTSPLRPTELPNPDHLTDDDKPGVDVTIDSVNSRANYLRRIAIPRRELTDAGKALFDVTLCSACHVPELATRADYPIALIAAGPAELYSDLLLHDMGDGLADGTGGIDGEAGPRDWRTAPLIGLRFLRTFLHDGRALSLEDAIAAHDGAGSEATPSVARFLALSPTDRQTLLDFVNAL